MDNKERFIEIFTSQIHRPGAAELLEKFARAAADWSATLGVFGAPTTTAATPAGWWNIA